METSTHRESRALGVLTSVQYVKGVGPRLASVLKAKGIRTVWDLLSFFPKKYEDRRQCTSPDECIDQEIASLKLTVISQRKIRLRGRRFRQILEVRCQPESSSKTVVLKWFHFHAQYAELFQPGKKLIATGKTSIGPLIIDITHPEVDFVDSKGSQVNTGRIVPVYRELDGISTRVFRSILWAALEKYRSEIFEDLPERFLKNHQLPKLRDTLESIHFPKKDLQALDLEKTIEFRSSSHLRMIYEEFFKFEFLVLRQRLSLESKKAPHFDLNALQTNFKKFQKNLPFDLTGDQKKSIDEILIELSQDRPSHRIVQGDVGSGKTAVCLLPAGALALQGAQSCVMAPTEILAKQHFHNLKKLLGDDVQAELLTGSTKASERKRILERLKFGDPVILIGTHALIEPDVQYQNLALVIIDEQHRFGVEQRRVLRDKGKEGFVPHLLALSATPIPRTLALTAYGDLSVSTLKEMPPGRMPIKTFLTPPQWQPRAYERIKQEIRSGRQAYFIFPLVDKSEAQGFENLKSAIHEKEYLEKEVFSEFKLGLLHGKLKDEEKNQIMNDFKKGDLDILVSTTVVEVGVDVPNATIMVIHHPERFGLSQLHQLRGRVGRGSCASICFLWTNHEKDSSRARLQIMEKTQDGFVIAEEDLKIRGPGEFLGTRQSGGLPFRMADLVRDQDWLLKARNDALELIQLDPNLEHSSHAPLRRFFEKEGSLQFERLRA